VPGRAILVWSGVEDPGRHHEQMLFTALSHAALDPIQVPKPGVILLKQTVDRVRASTLQHPGWSLYEEKPQ
jgi:hypothetical protein